MAMAYAKAQRYAAKLNAIGRNPEINYKPEPVFSQTGEDVWGVSMYYKGEFAGIA